MENEQKIWRYMSLAKFTHALSQKALWLARSDKLGDAWEMALDGKPLDKIISRHPISPVGEGVKETAIERTKRIMPLWRQQTFVSCWTVSESESHALWQIYCGNKEGVAIQTTYDRLKNSLQQHLALNFLKVRASDAHVNPYPAALK